jgi:hypothetical protein
MVTLLTVEWHGSTDDAMEDSFGGLNNQIQENEGSSDDKELSGVGENPHIGSRPTAAPSTGFRIRQGRCSHFVSFEFARDISATFLL